VTNNEIGRAHYNYGWLVVFACVISQMVALGLTINCFTLFLRGWTSEFHTSISNISIAITLFSLGGVIATPFVGIAADRFPARGIFSVGLIGLGLFHVLMSFTTAGWQIVALYTAILPWAVLFTTSVPCQAIVSRWFAGGRHLGLALGISAMGTQVGGVLLPRIISAQLPLLGWRPIFQIFAAIIVFGVLPFLFVVMREPKPNANANGHTGHGALKHGGTGGPSSEAPVRAPVTMKEVLWNRNFWVLMAVFFPAIAANLSLMLNVAPLVESHGFSAKIAGSLLVASCIVTLGAQVTLGALADRFGNRWPLIGVALVTASGYLMITLCGANLSALTAGVMLAGFSAGVWPVAASIITAEFGAAGFGRAFGLAVTMVTFAGVVPPIFARAQEITGTYALGLLVIAGVLLAGAVVGLRMDSGKAAALARRAALVS
jgi:MFS family permease